MNGIHELINHPWLINFDWDSLRKKTLKPPFVPDIRNVFQYLKCLSEDTEEEVPKENFELLKNK